MSAVEILAIGTLLAVFSAGGDHGALTGKVRDLNGAGIPGVSVELRSDRTGQVIQTRTDRQGTYDFRDLQGGAYTLKITSPGFKSVTVKSISLSDKQHTVIPVIELHVSIDCLGGPQLDYFRFLSTGDRSGNLSGTVRVDLGPKANNSPPVANAQVSLLCAGGRVCATALTDSAGRFRFVDLSPSNYGLRFSHPGFYPEEEHGYHVWSGRELVYDALYLERCHLGNCDPSLRPKKPPTLCE